MLNKIGLQDFVVVFLNILSNISSMRRSVLSPDETLRRELKIRRTAEYFFTNLEVSHLVMKDNVECLILLLKQNDFRRRN